MIVQKALICSVRLENKAFLPVKDDVLSWALFFFYFSLKKNMNTQDQKKKCEAESWRPVADPDVQRLFWNELSILKNILQCCMRASYWDAPQAFHND